MYEYCSMALRAHKDITECGRFFAEPSQPRQRMYEALRAYFFEGRPTQEVARAFGYSPGSFRVLCHQFRRDADPQFFIAPLHGPREQPKKSKARDLAVQLRKQNHSVYEISEELKQRNMPLSPTAVRELLRAEGFAPLPRRLDEQRPARLGPVAEPVADVREFSLTPGTQFVTRCGGLFLFVPDLVRLKFDALAKSAHLPGSVMIPPEHALRAMLALKLWSVERKSHVMALVSDPGLALFCGLNVIPKKSYLCEYSSRLDHVRTTSLLAAWHRTVAQDHLFGGESFNLDFHSVPYYGEDPQVEKHFVSMRSRSQPSVLAFLAQDAEGRAFCYSNADLRKGEEAEEIFAFIDFWKKHHGDYPRHLVFDSRLTTYPNLTRLDDLGITFITLRRRSPALLTEIEGLPPSAWRRVRLDVPARKYKTPRVFEQPVALAGATLRQLFVLDLGHEEPTILLTNDRHSSPAKLLTRYAQRMLIENALSDAVRFFHMDALSSTVGLKVDFDMATLVIASGLYRMLAKRMRGYADAQARHIFRDLIDTPADVSVSEREVHVHFHRRAHLPIIIASGLLDSSVSVPWWDNRTLRLSA
jgi:transposase-like protein